MELEPDDVQTYDFSRWVRALLAGRTWSIVGKASFLQVVYSLVID